MDQQHVTFALLLNESRLRGIGSRTKRVTDLNLIFNYLTYKIHKANSHNVIMGESKLPDIASLDMQHLRKLSGKDCNK